MCFRTEDKTCHEQKKTKSSFYLYNRNNNLHSKLLIDCNDDIEIENNLKENLMNLIILPYENFKNKNINISSSNNTNNNISSSLLVSNNNNKIKNIPNSLSASNIKNLNFSDNILIEYFKNKSNKTIQDVLETEFFNETYESFSVGELAEQEDVVVVTPPAVVVSYNSPSGGGGGGGLLRG